MTRIEPTTLGIATNDGYPWISFWKTILGLVWCTIGHRSPIACRTNDCQFPFCWPTNQFVVEDIRGIDGFQLVCPKSRVPESLRTTGLSSWIYPLNIPNFKPNRLTVNLMLSPIRMPWFVQQWCHGAFGRPRGCYDSWSRSISLPEKEWTFQLRFTNSVACGDSHISDLECLLCLWVLVGQWSNMKKHAETYFAQCLLDQSPTHWSTSAILLSKGCCALERYGMRPWINTVVAAL